MPKSQPASPAPKHRARRSGRQAAYRFSRFSPEYRARLLRGLCDLQDFCRKFACASLRQLLKHPKLADHEFSKYVMMKYEDGRNSTRSTVKQPPAGLSALSATVERATCNCLGEHASLGGTPKNQTQTSFARPNLGFYDWAQSCSCKSSSWCEVSAGVVRFCADVGTRLIVFVATWGALQTSME